MSSKFSISRIFGRDLVASADLCYQKGQLSKAAELYLKAGRFEQAARIFGEIEEVDRAVEVYRDAGEPLKAGELLRSKGKFKPAVLLFENAGAYRQAAETALLAKQSARAGRLFEQAGLFERAADCFHKAGDIEHALGAWEAESERLKTEVGISQDHHLKRKIRQLDLQRSEVLIKLGRGLEAAELLIANGLANRAARLFERGSQYERAAEAYLEANEPEEALKAIEQSQSLDDSIRAKVFIRCERYFEAGEILLKAGETEEAAEAFESAEAWARAAALWEEAELLDRAADLFVRVGRWEDAGRCYATAGQHEEAGKCFAEGGNNELAGDAYLAASQSISAVEHYLEAKALEAARHALESLTPTAAEYPPIALSVIAALVEAGEFNSADKVLKPLLSALATDGSDLQFAYWKARAAEGAGRAYEAREAYRAIAVKAPDLRDVKARIESLSSAPGGSDTASLDKGESTVSSKQTPAAASGPATPLGDPASVTAAGGSEPVVESSESQTETRVGLEDLQDLPFDRPDRLTPWWAGTARIQAVDRRSNKAVQIVSFPLARLAEPSVFRQSMADVSALELPSILEVEEVLMTEGEVLVLCEPFPGRQLSQVLAEGQMQAVSALNVVVQVCDALAAAHKMGVNHGWLCPSTILVNDAGRAKLMGFGLAPTLAEHDSISQAYLSPEARGGSAGPPSDMFSLGLLAVELLHAFLPADGSKSKEIDPALVTWPDELCALAPKNVLRQLIRCLSEVPRKRPSAEELKASMSTLGLVSGQVLVDRYEILGELGRGGMSRVYRAIDRELEDEVAIKTVLSPALGMSEDEGRLLREVQICRKITHPNVVRVHDFGRFPGGIFIIMELLNGPRLDRVIRHHAPMPLKRVKNLLGQTASALAEAHRLNIIHRDLKPGNVIIDNGRVKVMDFGIARMGDSPQLTRTGQVVGSPLYMSPEQIQGRPLSGTSDLYALGVIAYALITGREPFTGETTTAVVMKHLQETPPDIRQLRPGLPQPWVDMVACLLAKKPEDRYPNATELSKVIVSLSDE